MQRQLVIIAHNLRSTHNVGSLLRTAEGLGVTGVFLTGYTPYPGIPGDVRLPHEHKKLTAQIHKTALGAEASVPWKHANDIEPVLASLRRNNFKVVALEQHSGSIPLLDYQAPAKLALIVGREVEGIEPEVLEMSDAIVEIPMMGQKESFNVVQAAAMALHDLTFH